MTSTRKVQVQLEERVWKKLTEMKIAGESLSDVIERNIKEVF